MSMDARKLRCLIIVCLSVAACGTIQAATYQTVNFSVTADRQEVADQVGKAAEVYRQQLAIFWLGKPLPNWSRPCKIAVNAGALGAGGQTTFQFVRGEVLNWRMSVFGSLERILDSVLPHEINHTIFACHFRRPLPRWADEGAATLFEHRSEQLKQLDLLNAVVRNEHELISLRDLLAMKEYPKGQRPMLTLYAQGYALADFLVQQKGRHAYLKFISDGERGGWEAAIRSNFDHDGIESLERNWRGWVLAGMPKLTLPRDQMLAADEESAESKAQAASRPEFVADPQAKAITNTPGRIPKNTTVRLQSPDPQRTVDAVVQAVPLSKTKSHEQVAVAISSTTHSQEFDRNSSFSAPLPQVDEARSRTPVAGSLSDETRNDDAEVRLSPSTEESIELGGRFSESDEQRLFGSVVPPSGFEPTGAAGGRNAAALPTDIESSSKNVNSVLHSRERNESYGHTPQWAGFPGQKKLF